MLERDTALETYRVSQPPEKLHNEPAQATRIPDHPLKFLTYEGSVNEGKGSVTIAEAGTYEILTENENEQIIKLNGKVLKGKIHFSRIESDRRELRTNVEQ